MCCNVIVENIKSYVSDGRLLTDTPSTVKNLKQDEEILRKWTNGTHPDDFKMFLDLRSKGKVLLCPLNTYSTHGESNWLAPLYKIKQKDLINEWKKHIFQ